RHRQRVLGHLGEVVDREREDGAALADLVVGHAVARAAGEADACLGILYEAACLAAAPVEPHVLLQFLPLRDRRHRLAHRLRGGGGGGRRGGGVPGGPGGGGGGRGRADGSRSVARNTRGSAPSPPPATTRKSPGAAVSRLRARSASGSGVPRTPASATSDAS